MEEKEVIDFQYQQPKLSRVFSAHLFDFFASLVTGAVFFSVLLLLLHVLPFYKENKAKQMEIQLRSHLYVEQDGDSLLLNHRLESDDTLTIKEKGDSIKDALTFFFGTFLKENTEIENPANTYCSILSQYKDADGRYLFDKDGTRLYDNADEDGIYYQAYGQILTDYALGYFSYIDGYKAMRTSLIMSNIVTLLLSLSIGYFLFYLVFPLIFKRGRKTLGIKMNKIGYIALDGFSPSLKRTIFYVVFEWILVYLASFVTFGIPLFLSIGMMFLGKNHQTLAEYVTGIIVIDNEADTIYLDYFDYKAKHIKNEVSISGNLVP